MCSQHQQPPPWRGLLVKRKLPTPPPVEPLRDREQLSPATAVDDDAQSEQAAQQGDPASRTALAGIQALLGPGFSLASLAPCADEIRSADEETGSPRTAGGTVQCGGLQLSINPESEPWHFDNVPIKPRRLSRL